MELKILKEKLEKLKYGNIEYNHNFLQLNFNISSKISDCFLNIVFYKQNNNIFMTDDYFFIDLWTEESEIINYEPLNKIKLFAEKYDIKFNKKLEKRLNINKDIDKQIQDFFKVEVFADFILSQHQNI